MCVCMCARVCDASPGVSQRHIRGLFVVVIISVHGLFSVEVLSSQSVKTLRYTSSSPSVT